MNESMELRVWFRRVTEKGDASPDGIVRTESALLVDANPIKVGRQGFWLFGGEDGMDYYVAPAAILGMDRLDMSVPEEAIETLRVPAEQPDEPEAA